MRKLIFAINISVDGCCDHAKIGGGNKEMLEYYTALFRDADLFVYGRKTYQLMVPYWSDVEKDQSSTKAEKEFARAFESVNKVVFSRTLDGSGEAKNARFVRASLQDEILKLKQEPGKNILTGGVSVPSQLIELGLVDQFQITVHPIVVGDGRRLLEGISLTEKLQLVESKSFKSGVVALLYSKHN